MLMWTPDVGLEACLLWDKICKTKDKTSSKVDIPDGARKEIKFLFLHEIESKVKKYDMPLALIINIDQTP